MSGLCYCTKEPSPLGEGSRQATGEVFVVFCAADLFRHAYVIVAQSATIATLPCSSAMRNCRSSPTANYIVGEGFGLCILLMRLSNEYFFDTLKLPPS